MTRHQSRMLAGAVIASIVLVAAGWSVARRQIPADVRAPSTPHVELAVAHSGAVAEIVEAQGRVGPPAGSSAKIAFAQAGILRSVDVRIGASVRAGQQLAVLDRAALGAAVDQARADAQTAAAGYGGGAVPDATARSAAARLAVATEKLRTLRQGGPAALSAQIEAASTARRAALDVQADESAVARDEQLLAAGVLAAKDVEAARARLAGDQADRRTAEAKLASAGSDVRMQVAQAQADVAGARSETESARSQQGVLGGTAAAAQARLDGAEIAFANGKLRAPADGIVLAILKHPGEAVDATQPVFEIGPAFGRGVTLTVPADAVRRIAVGDVATLRTTPAGARATRGRVIAVIPVVDAATQSGTVVVSGAPFDAVPGDAVNATIVVGRAAGVIVPTSAIVQDPQTGRMVVFVRDARAAAGDSGFVLRTVTVRADDGTSTSLASGVKPGEHVAAQGGYALLAPAGG